jgi:hypothetical protein
MFVVVKRSGSIASSTNFCGNQRALWQPTKKTPRGSVVTERGASSRSSESMPPK